MMVILATIIVLGVFFIISGMFNHDTKKGEKISTFKALGILSYGGCLLAVLIIIVLCLVIVGLNFVVNLL